MEFWDTYKSYYNKKCWICWHLEINVAIGYILMVITYTEIKYTPYLITVQLGSHKVWWLICFRNLCAVMQIVTHYNN